MSHPWFRVYVELIDDPKFIKLGPEQRSALLMMWCVAAGNGGRLPSLEDTAIKFRLSEARTKKILDELRSGNFLDDTETGLEPHNWGGRQYKSDVSTERVKRFRKQERNVSETADACSMKRSGSVSVSSSTEDPLSFKEVSEEKSSGRRKRKTPLPADFQPDRDVARKSHWSEQRIDQQIQAFFDSARAHNRQYADWPAAWRNWVNSPYQQVNGDGKTTGNSGKDEFKQALRELGEFARSSPEGGGGGREVVQLLPAARRGE